jgi:hypothetical protein
MVLVIRNHLVQSGIKVWLDEQGSQEQVAVAIQRAGIVICCISPKYCESLACLREMQLAMHQGKSVVPCVVNGQSRHPNWPPPGAAGYLLAGKLYTTVAQAELHPNDCQLDMLLSKVSHTVGVVVHPREPGFNLAVLAGQQAWGKVMAEVIYGGIDTNQREPRSNTASAMQYSTLLYAAYYDKPELFSWLVQRGGDPRLLDTNKKSALHIATKYGSASIVRLLLLEGVDPTQKDCWGRVARDLLTDRRSVIKETSADSLKEVERVYDHWPAVKQALASGGVGGISALSKFEATTEALKAEAVHFVSILEQPTPDPVEGKDDSDYEMALTAMSMERGEPCLVFFSYCWANADIARTACRAMSRQQRCWLDIEQMPPGTGLYEAIETGLRNAKVAICCVSQSYLASVNCGREMRLIQHINLPVVYLKVAIIITHRLTL